MFSTFNFIKFVKNQLFSTSLRKSKLKYKNNISAKNSNKFFSTFLNFSKPLFKNISIIISHTKNPSIKVKRNSKASSRQCNYVRDLHHHDIMKFMGVKYFHVFQQILFSCRCIKDVKHILFAAEEGSTDDTKSVS